MTAFEGPLIVYGARNPPGQGGSVNPNKAPSPFNQGVGLLDDRAGYNNNRWGCITWMGSGGSMIPLINQVPQTLTTTNIAGTSTAVSGVALTLVTTANSGVTMVGATGVTVWASGTLISGQYPCPRWTAGPDNAERQRHAAIQRQSRWCRSMIPPRLLRAMFALRAAVTIIWVRLLS